MIVLPQYGGLLGSPPGVTTDPYFSSVVLLAHCDEATGNVPTDVTGRHTFTAAGAANDTSLSKFGAGSVLFGGSVSHIDAISNLGDFGFGTGDFCIEFWLYLSTTTGNQVLVETRPDNTNGAYIQIAFISGGGLEAYMNNGAPDLNTATGLISATTWTHIAVARVSGTSYVFIAGTNRASGADSGNYVSTRFMMGKNAFSNSNFLNAGRVDDIRVTKGVGRYSGNFTPPIAAFPNS